MGLIKAALGAAGGVMADQWKEYFYCESIPENVMAVKGQRRVSGRSSNTKGSENIISNGSVVAVADGQCMIIVDQGKVAELCAVPGEFVYDSSTEPTIFSGELGTSILDTFKNIGKRFTFGGEPPKDQRVYYFNTKELIGNKYGTPSPVPFRVVDQRAGIDIDIAIRCFGEYSYRISDPILFYTNVCGNVSEDYTRDRLDGQLKTELLTALQPAFAKISDMGIRYSALPGHTMELADALNEVLSGKWRNLRGLEIVSFGVSSVMNFTDASETLDELAPVNFLTSRFYAAVDIKLDYKPHVILLTDVMRAPFSAVDPQTEVVQAIGRFRNGVARAYHIANTSDNLQCLTREALERRLTGEENIYNQIRQIQPDGEDEAQARFQALNGMAYKRFVTRDGNRNHFMWDNAWTDEQIKAYYRYPSTLTAAYKSAPFRLTVCTAHYPITDADRLRREKAKMNTRELWREVVGQLAKLQTAHSDMEPAFLQEELGNEFAAIVQAFTILGAKRMEELGYSRSKIEAAMTRTEENVLLTAPKMQEAVYAQYKTGDLVACSEINNFLHRLIVNNGIPFEGRRVDRKVVKLFFEIEDDTKRLGGQKAFLLGKKMFEF